MTEFVDPRWDSDGRPITNPTRAPGIRRRRSRSISEEEADAIMDRRALEDADPEDADREADRAEAKGWGT